MTLKSTPRVILVAVSDISYIHTEETKKKAHIMAIKLDKNIPLPQKTKRGSKYPWGDMKVGDSFFVEGEPKGLYNSAKEYNIKITVRKWEEGNKKGMRVWRVPTQRKKKGAKASK